MSRVVDVVKILAPLARPQYLEAFEKGDALLQQHGITTPIRLAHFLAQMLHESGGLRLERENMNKQSAPAAGDLRPEPFRECHTRGG